MARLGTHTTVSGSDTDAMQAVPRLTRAGSCGQGWVRPRWIRCGPRAEPGLAEQVRLVLGWITELGCRKKKRWGGRSCIE
jgi:hypothetical protein